MSEQATNLMSAEQLAEMSELLNVTLKQAQQAEALGFEASILRKAYQDCVTWLASQNADISKVRKV